MQVLAEVTRGKAVESFHHGFLYIEDGKGAEVLSIGDPEFKTFIRSAAKPFQALPFILNGGTERFGFTEDEIALSCASHAGEKIHVKTAERMLSKLGLAESSLKCGTHFPFDERSSAEMYRTGEKPSQLHNNCSGKHATMLGQALMIGAEIGGYLDPAHPVQQKILDIVATFTDDRSDDIEIATDGCSAPNYLLSMRSMARSYVRLVSPPESFTDELKHACGIITQAMYSNPLLVAGTGRLDTVLMASATDNLLISKIGAEGVWLCGIAPCERWPQGLGISMKIADGDDRRARSVVAIELLKALGMIEDSALCEMSPAPVSTRFGQRVGEVRSILRFSF